MTTLSGRSVRPPRSPVLQLEPILPRALLNIPVNPLRSLGTRVNLTSYRRWYPVRPLTNMGVVEQLIIRVLALVYVSVSFSLVPLITSLLLNVPTKRPACLATMNPQGPPDANPIALLTTHCYKLVEAETITVQPPPSLILLR